jgi:hypothetical protein
MATNTRNAINSQSTQLTPFSITAALFLVLSRPIERVQALINLLHRNRRHHHHHQRYLPLQPVPIFFVFRSIALLPNQLFRYLYTERERKSCLAK